MLKLMTTLRLSSIVVAVVIVGVVRFGPEARSSTVTPNVTQKLTVYGGVVTVTPGGSGNSTLELGANGTDLISSGNLVIRPQNSPLQANTTRFVGGGSNVQSLSVSGDLKLTTTGRQICLQGNCRSSWAGGNFWSERLAGTTFIEYWLEPTALSRGVRIGDPTAPFTGGTPLTVASLNANNAGGGAAARFIGNVQNIANLYYYESLKVNGAEAWNEDNDGRGSGLDADNLDGVTVAFAKGNTLACHATFCLCFLGVPVHHRNSITNINNECLRFSVSDWP